MYNLYFYFSAGLLLFSAVICGIWSQIIHSKHIAPKTIINPLNLFFSSAFVSLLIIFIPAAYDSNGNYGFAFVSSLLDAIDSLSFGNSLEVMNARVFGNITNPSFYYRIYVCLLTLLVPFLGIRAVFLIFKDWFTQFRCTLNIKRNLHVFSQLNEKSIVVAKSIVSSNKNTRIVFCSASRKETNNLLIEKARYINAWLTEKSVVSFKINGLSSKKAFLYLIDRNEKNNLRYALDKVNNLSKSKRDISLLVFSSHESAEQVIDVANENNKNKHVRLDLFNEAQRTAYNIIYDYPLYDVPAKSDMINVMILGSGKYGLEFAKAAAWSSQMMTEKFNIRLFDKQDKERNIGFPFSKLGTKLKSIGTELESDFCVCDVFSEDFDKLRFERADYVFIDLGEDDNNIRAALLVYKLYSRKKSGTAFVPCDSVAPKIVVRIRDLQTKTIVESLNNKSIIPCGSLEDVFCGSNIYDWKIDRIAQFIHACYYHYNCLTFNVQTENDERKLIMKGMANYCEQSELNKRSSRAAAVHCKYKFYDLGINIEKDNLLSKENTDRIAEFDEMLLRVEHNRWNAFHVLDGWASWDKNALAKNEHKNKAGKLHAYLAEFDELKSIAEHIYDSNVDPSENDRVIIQAVRPAYLFGEYNLPKDQAIDIYIDLLK